MLMTAKGLCVKAIERLLPQDGENHSGNIPGRQVQWTQMIFVGAPLAARCRQEGVQPDGGDK